MTGIAEVTASSTLTFLAFWAFTIELTSYKNLSSPLWLAADIEMILVLAGTNFCIFAISLSIATSSKASVLFITTI